MTFILDQLYIKNLERDFGFQLTSQELYVARTSFGKVSIFRNGRRHLLQIPVLRFPEELTTKVLYG